MQLQLKFVRLDLTYSDEATRFYQAQRLYFSPQHAETVEHFVRRLLSVLLLFPQHPQLNTAVSSKGPDVFVADPAQHLQIWCQVDLPPPKLLQRACHQADEVWLILNDHDTAQWQHSRRLALSLQRKIHLLTIPQQQIGQACDMIKPHMQLSVWREPDQLWLTDGDDLLALPLQGQGLFLH